MPISELEIAAGLAIIAAIPLCIWVIRMTLRLLSAWPVVGLIGSLCLMGWAHQNPSAIPDLVDRATPDFMEQIEAQAVANAAPQLDESELTDENLVEHYHQQNVHYAHQVERAPRAAVNRVEL